MGDRPTWDGAGSRGVPGRTRRVRDGRSTTAEPVTVEQVLARQGSSVGRRRAARRVEEPDPWQDPPPAVRTGLPPVPGGTSGEAPVSRLGGLPPVPGGTLSRPPLPGAAPVHEPAEGPASWAPESRPSRRSAPLPPLPGLAPAEAAPSHRRRTPRPAVERPPLSPGRRRVRRIVTALVALFGVVVLYHVGLYFYVDQKIDRVDALATDGAEVLAPQLQADTETYLVVGTGVPGQEGPASVATLLASVSGDGERAVLVSVPPTALVDTPVCRAADGSLREATTEAFAAALVDGGPSCLVRAVQQLSGLRVDHYLGVDLTRLPGLVDALGGVPFCVVPSAAIAAAAVPPQPGPTTLSADAATGFLRPADPASDVTGAAVAERAQRLLISTIRGAMSVGTLTDTPTLTRFLDRAAGALTVDEQTTLGDLRGLAMSLGDLTGDAVQRAGLPIAESGYVPAGSEQSYVLLDGGATRTLFDTVIRDTELPAELLAQEAPPADEAPPAEEPPPAEEAPPAEEPEPPADGLTVPPAEVTVDVLNATGTSGLAATAAEALTAQGFAVAEVANAPGPVDSSVVRHGPDRAEQARTVAAAVPGAVLRPDPAVPGEVELILGPGYTTVVAVTMPPAPAPAPAPDTPAVETATPPAPVSC